MDVLTDKQRRQYNKLSRYQTTPFYFHTIDNKYTYGVAKRLLTTTNYVNYITKPDDTFDAIALKYYGVPTYYWIIADFNRLNDPLIIFPEGIPIKVPTLTAIEFEG